jgi:hypothetical protein
MNRRSEKRVIKSLEARVIAKKIDIKEVVMTGLTANMSSKGLFIRSERLFPKDSVLDVELILPDKKIIKVTGVVKRLSHTVKRGIGFKLLTKDIAYDDFIQQMSH